MKRERINVVAAFSVRRLLAIFICGWLALVATGCASPVSPTDNQPRTASDFIGRPRPPMP